MRLGIGNPLTKMNVKQQLLLLFTILVCPILALQWYATAKAEQLLKRHVTQAYAELNKQNHLLIERDLEAVNRVTKTIIQNPLTQDIRPDPADSISERIRKYVAMEELLTSYSQGANGETVAYAFYVHDPDRLYPFAPDNFVSDSGVYFYSDENRPDWIDEAVGRLGSGYLRFIDKDHGWERNGSTLAYVRAVNSTFGGNSVIGVLVVSNMEVGIGELLRTVNLPGGEIYLTDENYRILAARTPGSTADVRLPPEVMREANGQTFDLVSNGYIYVVSGLDGYRLVYRIPEETLLKQQNELTRVIRLISIVYAAFALLVMIYLWRSLMNPLQKLASFIRAYEPGRVIPNTPGEGRKDEVGLLIASVYDSTRRLNELVHHKYALELKQKESQLQLLYQQINPHMLYNTLESIYWKIQLEGRSESAEMIKELANLMKIGLSRGRELIELREELEHALAYTRLQQKRYEYSFRIDWNVPEELLGALIPKITLQPLIENAIVHGVRRMGEDGWIGVSAASDGGDVLIRVEDNGYKEIDLEAVERLLREERSDPSLGYGIRNVHQRIRLHFGEGYGISYGRREGGGTAVTIRLPLTRAEGDPGRETRITGTEDG